MNKQCGITHIGRYILLSVIFGIVTTISHYSGYGVGDHIEQLPIIIRSLDSTYLLNDFFTNASTDSIARLHYANLLATLAGSERNLPLVFLILTLCANISISVITFYFGRALYNNSNLAGIAASALVMSVSTFYFGWSPTIYWNALVPSTIAIPLALGAILAVTQGNLVVGMILSGIASIIHPLIGLETGGLLLITVVAFHLISRRKITKGDWKAIIQSLMIFTTFSLISIFSQFSQSSIDSNLIVYIIAYFRHPHHYIPSTFSLPQYVYTVAFLCATFLVYYRGRQTREGSSNLIIAILVSTVILLCIGGYIFVEIIPSRIWVTAQTFRLLYIVKWIGLILIAGTMVEKILEDSTKGLYLAGVLNSLSLGGVVLSQSFGEWLERNHNWFRRILVPSLILMIIMALYIYLAIRLLSIILLSFYVLLILTFGAFTRKLLFLNLLVGTILIIVVGTFHSRLPYLSQLDAVNRVRDNLTLSIKSQLGSKGDEIAEFARQNTPEESIFLTPPMWGQFRLLARRAIVVDFKAFPFADTAILEWYDRITNCYGNSTVAGFAMIDELNENYSGINDNTLLTLQENYSFSYAVLYNQTSSNFEVIFQNEKFKIVYLGK